MLEASILGSFPELALWKVLQMDSTSLYELVLVAIFARSPALTPTSAFPFWAMTWLIFTTRLNCVLQFPQERYSLPKFITQKDSMLTVPAQNIQYMVNYSQRRKTNNLTAAIVLDDLVRSILRATTGNIGGTRSLLEGDGILAHILKPDVVNVARTHAMDPLGLVGADNNVPKVAYLYQRFYTRKKVL